MSDRYDYAVTEILDYFDSIEPPSIPKDTKAVLAILQRYFPACDAPSYIAEVIGRAIVTANTLREGEVE